MGTFRDFSYASKLVIQFIYLAYKDQKLENRQEKLIQNDPLSPQLVKIQQERDSIGERCLFINQQLDVVQTDLEEKGQTEQRLLGRRTGAVDEYVRPDAPLSTRLGQPPWGSKVLRPTIKEMKDLKSHNLVVVCICIGVYVGMEIAVNFAPWLLTGVSSLWYKPSLSPDEVHFNVAHALAIAYTVLTLVFHKKYDYFLYRRAIKQEQQFRMGFENWTWEQRGYSHIAPIVVPSLLFLHISPVFVIFLVWLPQPVYSWLYLRTFKETGNAEYATLVTAKLKARFLKYFWLLLTALIAVSGVTSLMP